MMKKQLLLILLLAAGTKLTAQPWMPTGNTPVKFLDIVAGYQSTEAHEKEEEEERKEDGAVEEGEGYQFDRWCWYWKQHLDANGYIVPGSRGSEEWREFMKKNAHKNTAAKSTATDNWSFVGPKKSNGGYSGMGRVNVVAFDPVDSNVLYVGSAAGSSWKTTDGGNTWKPLYDNILSLSVSDIKVNPMNGNTVYVATGDADGGRDYSIGILKTYDGGTTWTNIGPSTWTPDSAKMSRSLLVNPLDTNKVMVATSDGLYKSGDGGTTWQRTFAGNFYRILYCPNDTAVVYAAVNGTTGPQVYRSLDGGFTWGAITTLSGTSKVNIAVSAADPGLIVAIAANTANGFKGIYKSTDHGGTFLPVFTDNTSCTGNLLCGDNSFPTTNCGGNAWYDMSIAVDPADANKIIVGGVNNYFSSDGGASWSLANQWWNTGSGLVVVHADKHWMEYNPLNHAMYLGCDGGLYKTYAPNTNKWKDLSNGIYITQFYRNAVNNDVAFCIGGAQDNGSKMVNGGVTTDLTGGDGMMCLISYGDPTNNFYTATQYGHVNATYDGGASFNSITDDLPTPGAWITPYAQHPIQPNTLIIGYTQVFMSSDAGTSWGPISPVFSPSVNIEVLAYAVSNPDYIYVVRDAGTTSRIHYTTNGGTSWVFLTIPFSGYISDLVVDPRNEQHFWVTVSGYTAAKVYSYNIATSAWTDESAGLPNMPVNCMVIDTFSQTQYVGTDAAVFYRTTAMSTWTLYNTNLPSVHVDDLNINHTTNEIWAATYGRGMWKSGKAELTPPVGVKNTSNPADKISIAPNPCHSELTISTPGVTFRNTAVNVRLISAEGRSMLVTHGVIDNTGKLVVRLGETPAGFYVCEMTSNKGVARAKLVVY